MSTADLLPRGGSAQGRRGFTIIEALITMVIVGLMTLVIERTVSGVTDTERLMRAIRNTAERGQKATYHLRDIVTSGRKVYGNDAVGTGYLAKLDVTRYPILAGSRLPVVDEGAQLGPDDVGVPKTGNVLLFVREADAARCIADPATKLVRTVDAYRFVCCYLSQSNRSLLASGTKALDLIEWRSHAYPSYPQVTKIVDATQKKKVVADLYNRYGYDYIWDPGAAVASAFYGIDGLGNISAAPTAVTSIPEDLNVSGGGRFVGANLEVARTDTTSRIRQSVFTTDLPANWVPNNFEVKIAGSSGARKVWIRMTVEQQAAAGRVPAQDTTVVATLRDL